MEQVLDRDKTVVLESATCCHQIHDRLGHTGDRAKLDGPVEMNKFNRKFQGIEVVPGAVGELAGNPAVRRKIRGTPIATAGFDGDSHATTAETKIHQLGDRQLMLSKHVVANHPKLGLSVGDVSRHITVSNKQRPGPPTRSRQHQLTIVLVEYC